MRRHFLLGAALVALASPALADHTGPSGVGSGGGGLSVISPDTLDEGSAAAGFRLTYSRPKQRSDAELEALAATGVDAHNSRYTINAALGFAYGITHELTVSAELPFVRRDRIRVGEAADGGPAEIVPLGSVAGIGDLSLLAKYRLTHGAGPGFALIAGLKMPTGGTHRHDNFCDRFETEHQPGTGSWDPIVGAAFGTVAGAVQFNASALYQVSGKGAQHTQLGDRLQGGIAVSHRFGPPEHNHDEANHHHASDEAEHHDEAEAHAHQSWDAFVELSGEWEGRQTIAGEREDESGGEALWLSPGARFNLASGWSAAAAIGLPLWQRIRASHPDNDYRLTLSIGRAFQ
jgi:hypothetical protein